MCAEQMLQELLPSTHCSGFFHLVRAETEPGIRGSEQVTERVCAKAL